MKLAKRLKTALWFWKKEQSEKNRLERTDKIIIEDITGLSLKKVNCYDEGIIFSHVVTGKK